MADVHDAAWRGFGAAADAYERGRPDYPQEAIDHLVRACGIEAGTAVVDLAAGTGKLTRRLLPTGAELVAVEPVAGMREALQRLLPDVAVTDGAAEAMPLADDAADVVAVGQAFHWFHGDMAVEEIARVLRPGGRLGLIWNVRDDTEDWVAALTGLLEAHRGDVPRYADGAWREALDRSARFTPLRHAAFRHVHTADVGTMLDRFASVSFVAAADEPTRASLLAELEEVLVAHADPGSGLVALPYRTDVYWCRVAD